MQRKQQSIKLKKMKKLFLGLTALSLIFTSCSKDDNNEETNGPATGTIQGEITGNVSYAYGNYNLKGVVRVKPGATLTIAAGSVITIDKTASTDNGLIVENGGTINLIGTADQPIVFTELSKVPGSWSGIMIVGDAPINAIGGASTAISEDGSNITYGGTDSADNSGTLKYVRVEYAGKKIADGQKETNSFTFYSVGSNTTLDHLVAYKGADDGYEFFGGTVSMTNAISYGNFDDAFDWQDGWKGQNNSNWYAYQVGKGNFGMEIEACSNNNNYWPVISNITLKRNASCVPEDVSSIEIDAFQFKKEGNGDFNNIVIEGYGSFSNNGTTYEGTGCKIQDATTNTNQVNGSKIKLTNVKITGSTTNYKGAGSVVVNFPSGQFTTSTTSTGASITNGAWSTVEGSSLLQ